jgi:uncharacterized protein YllA (UPF0747 family)
VKGILRKSVTDVYQSYVWHGKNAELADYLYGGPPITLGDAARHTVNALKAYQKHSLHSEERTPRVKETLLAINRELGVITPEVRFTIEHLHEGTIEASHQSVCMGGPAYILNKAATAKRIADIARENGGGLHPLFFMADYDQIQPELTNMRTPLLGPEGNLISLPVPSGFEESPVSEIPLPSDEWYDRTEESIRTGYRPLFKTLTGPALGLLEDRLEFSLSITRWAFCASTTLGEWAERIVGHLLNIEGHLGMPLLPASDPRIRPLFLDGMEFLLLEKNRRAMVEEQRRATKTIDSNGYEAGTGARTLDYVPFFYECPNAECNRSRIELHRAESGNRSRLTGRCPQCAGDVELEYDEKSPDLSEHILSLSPRVDTRQMLVDTLLPVTCHVGGPGEAAYYAQVTPCARALGLPFPAFVKYPRVYFNTPWSESLAHRLSEHGYPVLQSPELFRSLGKLARARKKGDMSDMNSTLEEMETLVLAPRTRLLSLISDSSGQGSVSTQDFQRIRFDIGCYLSWAYGEYAEEKLGQEASWSWIEWMLSTGVGDLFGPYERAYADGMKNGATVFVNFTM